MKLNNVVKTRHTASQIVNKIEKFGTDKIRMDNAGAIFVCEQDSNAYTFYCMDYNTFSLCELAEKNGLNVEEAVWRNC